MFKICKFCQNMYTSELCNTCQEDTKLHLNFVNEQHIAKSEVLKKLEKSEDATVNMPCFNINCPNTKLTYYTRETRSADESLSLYVKCDVCGEKTKLDE